ncbi:cytidylate kinase family protein [Rhodoferax sp.]|uniref:cytidylate kinase family protein n=1 Tax=Rhodoferax sp. TaxID=50421 RepID=UPI00262C391B|nr:cytidylate kinase family protein [Rhodoferax sp.]MDD2917865.1 cytidylate kinase family protein [Rhodoferax sp.]
MTVIAMTQEMGSLAKDVALELAGALNLSVMRKEVVQNVAGKMHVPTSLISRLREGKAGFIERATTDKERVAIYTAEEVFELANEGNVILRGWGSTCLLRPVPHVLSVRIMRSLPKRVEWLMHYLDTDDRELCEAEILRSDAAHASSIQQQFGVTWGDPQLYDIVLNTDRLSVAACVDQIKLLCSRPEFKLNEESHEILAGLTLSARVRAALKFEEPTKDVNITIEAKKGIVTLTGIVLNEGERSEVERVTSRVLGVTGVEDKLRVMTTFRRFTYAKT